MSAKEYPSVDYLRQCFRYEDGKLFWLVRPREHFPDERTFRRWNGKCSGKEAGWVQRGSRDDRRQIVVAVNRKKFYRSILTWMLIHGKRPLSEIDHKDRNPLNDSIDNLREADRHQQMVNRGKTRKNAIGYKGVTLVTWNKSENAYRARIKADGRLIHLGCFADPEKAHEAYREANKKYNGEFACDG